MKKGSIELTTREIMILIIVIIIAAIVIGLALSKLDMLGQAFKFLSGQGGAIGATS